MSSWASWFFHHLIWDPAGTSREGLWRGVWGMRKLLIAFAGSGVLTWLEWEEHHPPFIVIVELLHFVFVLAFVAVVVVVRQRFSHRH